MVKTAIAGGSGGLGKAIAAAILAKQTHEYIVLSSRPTSDDNTFVVSYDNVDSIKDLLEAGSAYRNRHLNLTTLHQRWI